jgi:hypothetical protein
MRIEAKSKDFVAGIPSMQNHERADFHGSQVAKVYPAIIMTVDERRVRAFRVRIAATCTDKIRCRDGV